MMRRTAILGLLCAALAAAAGTGSAPSPPNIIFIMSDDQPMGATIEMMHRPPLARNA